MKHAYDPDRMLLLNSTVAELKRKKCTINQNNPEMCCERMQIFCTIFAM